MFLSVMVKELAQKTTEMKKKPLKQPLVSFMHFEAGHKHEEKKYWSCRLIFCSHLGLNSAPYETAKVHNK